MATEGAEVAAGSLDDVADHGLRVETPDDWVRVTPLDVPAGPVTEAQVSRAAAEHSSWTVFGVVSYPVLAVGNALYTVGSYIVWPFTRPAASPSGAVPGSVPAPPPPPPVVHVIGHPEAVARNMSPRDAVGSSNDLRMSVVGQGVSVSPPPSRVVQSTWDEIAPQLSTGDVILFHGEHCVFSEIVEFGTSSLYSHVAIVLSPPHFFDAPAEASGALLMFESGLEPDYKDVEDGKSKFGVQIIPFGRDYVNKYDGKVYVRRLLDARTLASYGSTHHEELNSRLRVAHDHVHGKPYDCNPIDFLRAKLRRALMGDVSQTRAFFCSALVAYLFHSMGLIEFGGDGIEGWDLYAPKDFSCDVDRTPGLAPDVLLEGIQHEILKDPMP
eukprot:Opistho-1_new@63016